MTTALFALLSAAAHTVGECVPLLPVFVAVVLVSLRATRRWSA